MKTILPHLFVIVVGAAAAVGDEKLQQTALVAAAGARVATWQSAPNPNKPYIAQLFAPGKEPVPLLDDSPADHFHHHGLMFAIAVDGTDFWTEQEGGTKFGRQEPVETVVAADGSGFTRRLRWTAPGGGILLQEKRQVVVRTSGEGDAMVHWLDWTSTLTPAAGRDAVRLSGHHYFGLGMRFLPAWSGRGEFLWEQTAGQKVVRGDERLTPGAWCAVRCTIDGRPVTVLMIDDSANARPVCWFTMAQPFCYLSAALGLDAEAAELKSGETWTLRYGIAVVAGNADRARLTKLAAEWRTPPPDTQPEPSTKP